MPEVVSAVILIEFVYLTLKWAIVQVMKTGLQV
jgi:hypothetical protein